MNIKTRQILNTSKYMQCAPCESRVIIPLCFHRSLHFYSFWTRIFKLLRHGNL